MSETFIPEFVQIFAENTVRVLREYIKSECTFNYDTEDTLYFIITDHNYDMRFSFCIEKITPILIENQLSLTRICATIKKEYKKYILGKFFRERKTT